LVIESLGIRNNIPTIGLGLKINVNMYPINKYTLLTPIATHIALTAIFLVLENVVFKKKPRIPSILS